MTVKETYLNRKILFSVLSRGEPSFLDLHEVGGVDGGVWRWMIFSRGSQRTFLPKTAVKALDRDLGFV